MEFLFEFVLNFDRGSDISTTMALWVFVNLLHGVKFYGNIVDSCLI